MSEIDGVFKVPSRNWWFREDYNWAEGSHAALDDRAVATIREYLDGNVVDVRLSAQNSNAATSVVQMFVEAAAAIGEKLGVMEELAEKSAYGDYSDLAKAEMQEQVEALAGQINKIVDDTSYVEDAEGGVNKLLSGQGETVEAHIDKSRSVRLFSRDLSFNVEDVDLTGDASDAHKVIRAAGEAASEYTDYLNSQAEILADSMAGFESELAAAAGLESDELKTETAQEIAAYIAEKLLEEPEVSLESQSNISGDEALYLLNDTA
ncbi:MAG: flagellin N-terminal helical domain-containing protein [Planctomycetota bacterium]|jgi:HAMP domain-containing protein